MLVEFFCPSVLVTFSDGLWNVSTLSAYIITYFSVEYLSGLGISFLMRNETFIKKDAIREKNS